MIAFTKLLKEPTQSQFSERDIHYYIIRRQTFSGLQERSEAKAVKKTVLPGEEEKEDLERGGNLTPPPGC